MRPCFNGRLFELHRVENRLRKRSLNACTFQHSAILRFRFRPLLATPHYRRSCSIDLIEARGGGSCKSS